MARELNIRVTVDNSQAKPALADTEKGVKGVTDEAAAADKTLASLGVTTASVGKLLAGMFVASEVAGAIREFSEFASTITDLHDRTNISVETLQQLNYALAGSAVTVGDVVTATDRLVKRLMGGDSGAIDALAMFGLTAQDLKGLGLDEAILRIADASGKVADPWKRNAAMLELFGQIGPRLLPVLNEHLRETMAQAARLGVGLDKDLIQRGARFDEAWARGKLTLKSWTVQLVDLGVKAEEARNPLEHLLELGRQVFSSELGRHVAAMAGFTGALDHANTRVDGLKDGVQVFVRDGLAPFKLSIEDVTAAEKKLEAQVLASITMHKHQAKAVAEARREHEMATRTLERRLQAERDFTNWIGEREIEAFRQNNEAIAENSRLRAEWHEQISDMFLESGEAMDRLLDDLQAKNDQWLQDVAADMASHEHDMIAPFQRWGTGVKGIFGSVFETFTKGLPALFGGVGGGGHLADAIGAGVGSGLTTKLFEAGGAFNGFANTATKKISDIFGKGIGDAFGMALPGIGALVGPLLSKGIGALGSWIGGLFGQSKENKHRDSILTQWAGTGDLDAASDKIRELGFAAGVSDEEMRSLFSVKRIEDFDRIFGSITDQIAEFNLRTAQSLQVMKAELATPVVIPVTFGMINPMLGGGGGTDMFSPRNFASFADWSTNWLGRNPGDEHRLNEALGGENPWGGVPQFATGGPVPGRGPRRAIVHGGEGVLSARGMEALGRLNDGQGLDGKTLEQRMERLLKKETEATRDLLVGEHIRANQRRDSDLRSMLALWSGRGLSRV
jgi:hypothetical protein